MGHADLGDRPPGSTEPDEQLGREERSVGLDPDAVQRLAPEELARAIDVGDRETEEQPIGQTVRACVKRPHQRIGALDAIPDDDVGSIRRGQALGQSAEILDAELAVAIGERDELVASRRETGAERGAVPEVRRVVDRPDHAGMGGRELIGEGLCPIA